MNSQVRKLMVVVIVMFVTLFVSTSIIQFFQAPSLKADGRNSRTIFETSGRHRGQIIVGGQAIASSQPSDDAFKYQRIYSPGPLYAPITGYYSGNLGVSTGLEATANDVLVGDAPSLLRQRIQRLFTGQKPQGGSVELTLDPHVQQAAWKALNGRRGAAVAYNPQTGAILAAVSSPSYDPNKLVVHDNKAAVEADKAYQADPAKPMDNRAFGNHRYFPGSTFKLITAAAALSSGDYSPDTTVDAPVELKLPQTDITLKNYGGETCGDGHPTLQYTLEHSCNTPFASIGMELGKDAIADTAEAFGFNQSMTIPLPVGKSFFPSNEPLSDANLAMSSIGQYSVQATPLQMAVVAGTIANGGEMMQPYVIERELDGDLDQTKHTTPKKLGNPISQSVSDDLKTMMISVVENGNSTAAKIPGVQVAGKTGTAEHGDDKNTADAWWVGFAPADNPTIAVAVVVEGGQPGLQSGLGARDALPVAKSMIQAHLASQNGMDGEDD